jgi:serine/threonine protein phosphatase 1
MTKLSKKVNAGDVVAIGDIHARYDVLAAILKWLNGTGARVILLGDLIDRGGEDMKVLNKVKELLDNPESIGLESFNVLMGNHERMFMDAAGSSETMWGYNSLMLWAKNGGNLKQFEEMKVHYDWIKQLPIYMTVGDTMFIHAGVLPGSNPKDDLGHSRSVENLLWMREPFLSAGPELKKWTNRITKVVHGHTIRKKPDINKDRIGIDTGAVFSGVLTAYNATQDTYRQVKRKETVNIFS